MTEFGYYFIFGFLIISFFSIYIGKKWTARLQHSDQDQSLIQTQTAHQTKRAFQTQSNTHIPPSTRSTVKITQSLFQILICFSLFSISLSTSYILSSSIYQTLSGDRYTAQVTHYTSEWVENTDRDSSGNTVTTRTLMHLPYVSFKNQQGILVNDIPLNISSGREPIIGEQIQISYNPNTHHAFEYSLKSLILYSMFSLFNLILWFLSTWIILYSLNYNTAKFIDFAIFLILRIITPIASTAMFASFLYVLFEYFFLGNPQQFPIWVVAICVLFSVFLLPLIYSFVFQRPLNHSKEEPPSEH